VKLGAIFRGDECLVPRAWRAVTPWTRLRGLLGRPRLAASGAEALLLEPCPSVHTFGMRYALDLVFLDAQDRVVGTAAEVRPWRTRAARGARKTLELDAGSLAVLRVQEGETLSWRER